MSKFIKLIFALALIAILLVSILLWNLNPILESLRPKIKQALSQQLKEEVELGAIEAQLFPSFAIKISDVALKNKRESAALSSLTLDTSLGDLIKGKVTVKRIGIQGLSLEISREKDGSLNLAGLGLTEKKEAEKSSETSLKAKTKTETKEQSAKKENKTSLALEIEEIKADGINLKFLDKSLSPPKEIAFKQAKLEIFGLDLKGASKFQLSGKLLGSEEENISLKGQTEASLTALGIPKGSLELKLAGLDLGRVQDLLKAYKLKPEALKLEQTLDLNLRAELGDSLALTSEIDGTKSSIEFAKSLIKKTGLPFKLKISAKQRLELSADLQSLSLELGKISLLAKGNLASDKSDLNIEFKALPLEELAEVLPSLAALNLSGAVKGKSDLVLEPSLSLLPRFNADLELDNIAASVLSSLNGELKARDKQGKTELALDLSSARILEAELKDTKLRAELDENLLEIKNLSSEIFGGRLQSSAKLQTPLKASKLTGRLSLEELDLEQAFGTFSKTSAYKVQGLLKELNSDFSADLRDEDLLLGLRAKTSLLVSSGEIAGSNILKQTLEKVNSIPGVQAALIKYVPERLSSLLNKEETVFDSLEILSDTKNKEIIFEKLELKHKDYEISASGTANFDSALDLLARLRLSQEISKEIVLKEAKLKLLLDGQNRLSIPISIKKSSSSKPIVLPELKDLAKNALKNTAKEAIDRELKKRGTGVLGKEAGKLLQGLF